MPACTDYWINDSYSDPLLVITEEVDAALTKAIPRSAPKGAGRWSESGEAEPRGKCTLEMAVSCGQRIRAELDAPSLRIDRRSRA